MEEKIVDIKNLSNEDLLLLHSKIEEHLKYLDDSVISLEAEAGDAEVVQANTDEASESSDTSDDNAEEDGGEEDE